MGGMSERLISFLRIILKILFLLLNKWHDFKYLFLNFYYLQVFHTIDFYILTLHSVSLLNLYMNPKFIN